ncbi:MAG: flagellar hook protein FlgE [Candidatus Sericytochromatia bacterium]|nr:flagellar hook protein FlgE [Candidatus Tanganyikabacteria bacterium]
MMRSFNSGVTGLKSHQTRIDVIGNNIANVNTNGFKQQRVEFQTLVSQIIREGTLPTGLRGGTNQQQVGLGVNIGAISSMLTQGALQYTGKNTDLGMQGEGYFLVKDGTGTYYTRDGGFDFDRSGTFVRPANGMKVQGWQAVDGKLDTTAPPGDIKVARGLNLQPNATSEVKLKGNLKSDVQDLILDGVLKGSSDPAVDPTATTVQVKLTTSKNELVKGLLTISPIKGTAAWSVKFDVDSADAGKIEGATSQEMGTITFDTSGKLISNTLQNLKLAFKPTNGANPIDIPVVPSQLVLRPDVQASRIGLAAPSGQQLPVGAAGQVAAGSYTMTVNFFDSLGNGHAGNLIFSRDLDEQDKNKATAGAPTRWRVSFAHADTAIKNDTSANPPAGGGPLPIELGTVSFDNAGLLVESNLQTLKLKYLNGSADSNISFDAGIRGEITGLTQFTTSSTALVNDQNGFSSGTLQGYSIDDEGIITGVFTNGQMRKIAQVATATFTNPQGLTSLGANMFRPGNNSGEPQIGVAGTGGRGTVSSGNLEMSNVDLAGSFSDLIITQRGFQANTRIITTSDELLQELIQLKR